MVAEAGGIGSRIGPAVRRSEVIQLVVAQGGSDGICIFGDITSPIPAGGIPELGGTIGFSVAFLILWSPNDFEIDCQRIWMSLKALGKTLVVCDKLEGFFSPTARRVPASAESKTGVLRR